MKEVIESLRKLLKNGVCSAEKHISFSQAGLICQKTGTANQDDV